MFSSMTPHEQYNVTGTLRPDTIEALLELATPERMEAGSGATIHIREASGQFMPEDFMAEQIGALHALAKTMRGEKRDTLQYIIEQIDDAVQCQSYASVYGQDELHKATKCLMV